MGRIKNDNLYIIDSPTSKFDKVIGSDADNSGRTKNYLLGELFALFNTLSGGGVFSYTYTPNLSTLDTVEGLFATNDSEADPDGVNLLRFSRTDLFGNDLRTLVENYNNNSDGVVLKVTSEIDPNLISAYTITGINVNTNWVEISVLRHKNLNTLTFEADKNFSLTFDLVNLNGFGGGGGATNTSQLVNDGEDGINPFISLQDLITDHTALSNIGLNTHDQIDSHIADGTIHFTEASINITESQISDLQSYLLSEVDPVFTAWLATSPNISSFTNDIGYLTSFSELDPIFTASPAFGITNTNITKWDTAFGWGNHALGGYLKITDVDTFAELDGFISDAFLVKQGDNVSVFTNDAGYLTSYTETDPIFLASPAGGILAGDITNWDNAVGWGDHAGLYVGLTGNESVSGLKTFANTIYTGGNIRILTTGNKLEFGNSNVAIKRSSNNLELGGYDKIIFKSSNTTIESQTERMRIISTGNVGIGTTSPTEKLDVSGNIKLSETAATTDTDKFAVLDTGLIKYRTGSQVLSDIGGTSETLSQNISFGESYASNYRSRVLDAGGTFFPRPLGYEIGLIEEQNLFKKAKLTLLPSGVGVGSLYNVKPKNDTFDFTRSSTGTYVDEDGFIVVASSNTPRLDYSDGGYPSLLLEPERTNLIISSEGFTVPEGWSNTRLLAVPNSTVSPNGTMDGTKLVENTDLNSRNIAELMTSTGAGDTVVGSVFAKKADYDYIMIKIIDNAANVNGGLNYYRVSFNIANGTFNAEAPVNSPINPFYNIEDYGSGWYRISVGLTKKNNAVRTDFEIQLVSSDTNVANPVYQGDGVSGTYIWGAQVEQGSYATSYIPTNGSAVTRLAETCTDAGNASTFNDSEGVLFAEISSPTNDVISSYISISDGTFSNRLSILFSTGTNVLRTFLFLGGVSQFSITTTAFNITEFNKIAIKYKTNDFAMWVNGVKIAAGTSGNTFPIGTLNKLSFSEINANSGKFIGKCKQLQYFDTALTDDELITLTKI